METTYFQKMCVYARYIVQCYGADYVITVLILVLTVTLMHT